METEQSTPLLVLDVHSCAHMCSRQRTRHSTAVIVNQYTSRTHNSQGPPKREMVCSCARRRVCAAKRALLRTRSAVQPHDTSTARTRSSHISSHGAARLMLRVSHWSCCAMRAICTCTQGGPNEVAWARPRARVAVVSARVMHIPYIRSL